MLKRPRLPSPSPTRPDPLSPPPLENNAHLPFRAVKRCRTVGPVLDSYERHGPHWNFDDGEDEYDYDDGRGEGEDGEVSGGTHDKVYEHVNHVLHGLHTEQQYRSRTQSTHWQPQWQTQHNHAYRDHQSPASSPVKPSQAGCSFTAPYRERLESQETEDGVEQDRFRNLEPNGPHKSDPPPMQDDERLRVTHRYEDTNRLLGSLVLSRRRTLGTPPINFD